MIAIIIRSIAIPYLVFNMIMLYLIVSDSLKQHENSLFRTWLIMIYIIFAVLCGICIGSGKFLW